MNSVTQKNGKTKQTDYVLTPMLDELVRNVEFLGENVWFPSGAITILGGRKRCGKSTLALYECARFSVMGKKVLIVQREDDAGLVKAKLQCMGADLGNIMLYKRRAGGIEYCGFNAGDLRGIVESAGKMHADLVYIDPLHGLAAGRMNDQQSADCLIALDAMAEWMHAAVHLNGNHMLTRELFHQAESKEPQVDSREAQKGFLVGRLGAGQGG